MNDAMQRYNSLTRQGRLAFPPGPTFNPTAASQAPGMGTPVGMTAGAPAGYALPSQVSLQQQGQSGQEQRYPMPPPMPGRDAPPPNYFPTAPSSTPQLPMAGGNGMQQQQQAIGAEFGPLLQQLKLVAEKYPEVEDIITQVAGGLMTAMNKLGAQASQNGIPRSLV